MEDPTVHLRPPHPHAPFLHSVEGLLHLADYASLGHWAIRFVDWCLLATPLAGTDLAETVSKWWSGDWEQVATSADALRNLSDFVGAASVGTGQDLTTVLRTWDGRAATAAEGYFDGLARQLGDVQDALATMAESYDKIAFGVYHLAAMTGSAMEFVVDLAVLGGLAMLADALLAETPGAPADTAITGAMVVEGAGVVGKVYEMAGWFGDGVALIEGTEGVLTEAEGVLDRFRRLELPARPYDFKLA